jgi:hypothetical protein
MSSESLFNNKINNVKKTPGNIPYHGASDKYILAFFNMIPQLGLGGFVPRPRKLSAASIRTA